MSTSIPAHTCRCGYTFEAASPLPGHSEPGAEPAPGALTFCMRCGAAYQFGEQLELVAVDLDKVEDMDPRQRRELRRIQRLIPRFWTTTGRPRP